MFWESGDVAMVVPITNSGKFVVVKQYKHGAREIMIEFPAGYLNEGENATVAARREVFEETGYKLKSLQSLAKSIHQPIKEDGILYTFLAVVDEKPKVHRNLDKNEEIEILELTKNEVLKMIQTGEIWADGTITAFFLALDKLGLLEIK